MKRKRKRGIERFLDQRPLHPPTAELTDWMPVSVPGRQNADGSETHTSWFAPNRATGKSISFATYEEAAAFCYHPENQR